MLFLGFDRRDGSGICKQQGQIGFRHRFGRFCVEFFKQFTVIIPISRELLQDHCPDGIIVTFQKTVRSFSGLDQRCQTEFVFRI